MEWISQAQVIERVSKDTVTERVCKDTVYRKVFERRVTGIEDACREDWEQ
jgi:hypothetical protein